MRVTSKVLESQLRVVASVLCLPTEAFNEKREVQVGALLLNKAYGGYKLEQVMSPSLGVRELSPRLKASEMYLFLRGMAQGIALKIDSEA